MEQAALEKISRFFKGTHLAKIGRIAHGHRNPLEKLCGVRRGIIPVAIGNGQIHILEINRLVIDRVHQADVDFGVLAHEGGQARYEPDCCDGGDGGNGERGLAVTLGNALAGRPDNPEGLRHGGSQFHALRRWQGLAALAVKKRHAKPLLKLANLVAHRRLGDMQFIGRLGKAVAAGRRFKAFQGIQGRKARHGGSMKITHTLCERSSFDSRPTCRPKGQPDFGGRR